MKIKITSDSTCDLTQELLDRFHIATVPLYVIMDGVSYRDSVDITTEQIFAHVAAGGALCSTSAVSENDYIEFFTRELQDCEGLVHVTLSSKMSVCYQNACNAARRFEHVQVVDSLNLSSAQGLIVMEGAELAQDQTLDEVQIAQRLREIVPKVDGSFVLEDLEYLRKAAAAPPWRRWAPTCWVSSPASRCTTARWAWPRSIAAHMKKRCAIMCASAWRATIPCARTAS